MYVYKSMIPRARLQDVAGLGPPFCNPPQCPGVDGPWQTRPGVGGFHPCNDHDISKSHLDYLSSLYVYIYICIYMDIYIYNMVIVLQNVSMVFYCHPNIYSKPSIRKVMV